MRIKSGIKGFDNLIQGGFPKGSVVLVSGSPGTGKSIFSLEFLYHGARLGEKGLFISFEQTPDELISQGNMFGWNLENFIMRKKLIFKHYDIMNEENFSKKIIELIREVRPDRVVIDSLSTLLNYIYLGKNGYGDFGITEIESSLIPVLLSTNVITRFTVQHFINELKNIRANSLLISELPQDCKYFSSDKVSEFLADGIILLEKKEQNGKSFRTVRVEKMRETVIKEESVSLKISSTGIAINEGSFYNINT